MSSKRMMGYISPVEYMVGKFGRVEDKVSVNNPGYKVFVGFKTQARPNSNRFQLKTVGYKGELSEAQQETITKFKTTTTATNNIMQNPEQLATYKEKFAKQTKYVTLRGFVFASLWNA